MTRGKVFYDGTPQGTLDYFEKTVGLSVPRDINPSGARRVLLSLILSQLVESLTISLSSFAKSDWFLTIAENYEKSTAGEERVQHLIATWSTHRGQNPPQLKPVTPSPILKHQFAVSWLHELLLLSRRNFQQIVCVQFLNIVTS